MHFGFSTRLAALTLALLLSGPTLAQNNAPIANDDGPFGTDEDQALTNINVIANDTDIDGDLVPSSAVLDDPANNGTASSNGDGTFNYSPNLNYFGGDSFDYRVCDALNNCDTATVTISVASVNDAPTAIGQNVQTDEDVDLPITLTGSDPDGVSPLNFNITDQPNDGTLLGSPPNVTYRPNTNYNGGDSFRFTVNDGSLTSPEATINIDVRSVNDTPASTPIGNQSAEEGAQFGLNVSGNFDDVEDNNLEFSATGLPASLAPIGTNSGVINGTPTQAEADANGGVYNVTVRATDDDGAFAEESFQLTIGAVNDPPVADDKDVTTDEDTAVAITLTGSDPEGTTPLNFVVASQPVNGTLSGTAPNLSYLPNENYNGSDSFTYTVSDGELTSDPATVDITVQPVNDPPTLLTVIGNQTGSEDVPFSLDVSGNFEDVDGDTLGFTAAGLPASLEIGQTSGVIDGTPTQAEAEFNGGIYDISVTATDAAGESVDAQFTLTVLAVNDAPVADPQNLVIDEDTTTPILLTGSDEDNDLAELNFVIQQQPVNGILAGTAPNLTYTPNENYFGDDSFTFVINDGTADSVAATVSIEISSVNDLPVVVAEIPDQQAVEASLYSLDIAPNFVDADEEPLTYSIGPTDLPASGNLVFDAETGIISGTPQLADAEFDSEDPDSDPRAPNYDVTITATDAAGATASDTFQLTINALGRANLGLSISVAPSPAMLNDELQWTFSSDNPVGPEAGEDVELNGTFVGSGMTVTTTTGTCTIEPSSGQTTEFTCTLGSLPVGGTSNVILSTTTSEAGDVIAYATAAGINPIPIDPNLEDNTAQGAVGVATRFSNGAVQILGASSTRSVAAGDLNGDGSNDIVVGTVAGQPIQVYTSSGFRDFATAPISLSDSGANEGVALADFDNNGTLDIAVANGGGANDVIYSNDGNGIFSEMAMLDASFSQDVAVGDFNNDGNADVAFAAVMGNPVYLGDGSGRFTLDATLGDANSMAVAVARFDDNGRDDLVFANVGSPSRVWTKRSGAGFDPGDDLAIGDAVSVAVGDFGGDTSPDLVFGRVPVNPDDIAANPVLINDGTGTFGAPRELLGSAPTGAVHVGDVSGDGAPDLVFINTSGLHQIWNNTGDGFELHVEQIVDLGSSAGVLTELGLTDVDEPVAIDLAMGGDPLSGIGVFLNDGFGNLGRGDAVPPTLTLLGDDPIEVPSGSTFADPGATAEDNIDGDISPSVVADNPVDTAIVGSYTVTYTVSDFAGNPATPLTRVVIVTPAQGTGGGGGGMLSVPALLLLAAAVMICSTMTGRRQRRPLAEKIKNEGYRHVRNR